MAAEQMHAMDQAVDRRAERVLVHSHAPERRDAQIAVTEQLGQQSDFVGGYSRQLLDVLGCVGLERLAILVEGDRLAVQVRVIGSGGFEVAVRFDESFVVAVVLEQQVGDPVGDRQIAVRLHFPVVLALIGGPRSPGGDIDQGYLLAPRAAIDHAREEYRMHLGRIVSPHDQHVTMVKVVIASGRLVNAVRGEKARDGRGHAEPRVGIDVIVGQAPLHELLGRVTFGDRPLARTIKGEPLGRGFDPIGDH